MKMNTLIVYATKHGTAGKCASVLSKKLSGTVGLHHLKAGDSLDLTKYDRVIIGGSIYVGRIQNEISTFCAQNLNELKGKKLGLFICCMFKNSAEAEFNSSFPEELLNSAAAKECFGGELRFSDMSFGERLMTKMVSKTMAKNDESLSGIDMKKDVSRIDDKSIDRFADMMNIA
jgi:menaquinone-dependent protoporphyrinogen oxidase